MRPIYLEIEGLQSYKALQKIDFEELIKSGLFGIFGNTGSGKSTILDAITLALYGKVSRAGRGTQGVMNNECDRMRVMFDFSMLKSGERKTYRVERVFVRKSETGYDTKTARMFVVKDGGYLPVAEKATDIEAAVKELIGLEYEDFTRAVVLPQNKFQEFLTMDKAKKLSMLERLFSLSEYGEKLIEKVKVKIYELEKEYENVKGQLSAIESSDDKALEEAKAKFAEVEKNKEVEFAKFKTLEEEFAKVKDLYEASVNIIKFENELQTNLSEKDYYDRLSQKVELSTKAKEVEPIWENYKAVAQEIKNLKRKAEELHASLEKTEGLIEACENRCKVAAQNSKIALPGLYDKKAKLEQGIELQEKFDVLTKAIEEKETRAGELKEALLLITEKKNKNQIRKSEINATISGYDEFFKENKPRLAYRTILIEGQKLEHEAKMALSAVENAKTEVQRLTVEKETTEKDIAETENIILQLREKNEKRKASVESTINQYKSFKADYMAEKAKLEEELEHLWLDETAYRMAGKLKDAVPCPVCGSMHHPSPAKENLASAQRIKECKEEIARYEQEIEDADRIILGFTNGYNNDKKAEVLVEIEGLTHEIAANTTKKDILRQRLNVITEQLERANKTLEGAVKIHFEKNNILTRFMTEKGFGEISKELENLDDIEKNITATEAEIYTLRGENEKLAEEFTLICQKQSQIETELAVTESTAGEQKMTLREVSKQLTALVGEGTVYEEIEKINEEINVIVTEKESSEAQLEELQKSKEVVVSGIQETGVSLSKLQAQLDETEKNIEKVLEGTGINSPTIILQAKLSDEMETNYCLEIKNYEGNITRLKTLIAANREKLAGKTVTLTEYDAINKRYEKASVKRDEVLSGYEVAKSDLEKLTESNRKWKLVSESHKDLSDKLESFYAIKKLLAGNKFVEYVAEESLRYVLLQASEILSSLTGGRYRIELGTEGDFVIKDYLAGGSYRTVSTLSGGETFLASLSLAVALSKQIQLKGQSPLEFFFLDEGFGSLDGELLDTVITSLELLSTQSCVIGLVSHLSELQQRIPRRLVITKDEYNSSVAKIEYA